MALLLPPFGCGDDGTSSGGSETSSSGATESTSAASTTTGSDTTTTSATTSGGMSDSNTGTTTSSMGTTAAPTTPETETSTTGLTADPTTDSDTAATTGMGTTSDTTDTGTDTDTDTDTDTGTTTGGDDNPLWNTPNLWYSVENKLHYIAINEDDGSVLDLVTSTINTPLLDGFTGLTMLEDGSLLGSRVLEGQGTQIFYVADPPTEPSTIDVEILGMVPDTLLIEALYTDCKGLVYLMDSGADLTTAAGNRLIRFTGDYLGGDLNYEVITDLENASVADIDDLAVISHQGEREWIEARR